MKEIKNTSRTFLQEIDLNMFEINAHKCIK